MITLSPRFRRVVFEVFCWCLATTRLASRTAMLFVLSLALMTHHRLEEERERETERERDRDRQKDRKERGYTHNTRGRDIQTHTSVK